MAEPLEFARPMVRGCAGLDPYDAPRQLLEERQDVPALELAADDHVPFRVDAVDLKDRLRDIETDCRHRLHARLPRGRARPIGDHFDGTYVPVEEPSTASQADCRAREVASLEAA